MGIGDILDAIAEGAKQAYDWNTGKFPRGKGDGDILDEITDPVVLAAATAGGVACFVISKKSASITIAGAVIAGTGALFAKYGL